MKMRKAGKDLLPFIVGPRGKLIGNTEEEVIAFIQKKYSVDVFFLGIMDAIYALLAFSPNATLGEAINALSKFAHRARAKDEAIRHIKQIISDYEEK